MEWLALAIFVSTVLYLIDKNRKWRAFGTTLAATLGVLIVAVVGFFLYSEHQDRIANRNRECAAKVRRTYPGAYNDLDDATLAEKTLARYPSCEIPITPLRKNVSGYVGIYGSCPGGEQPDYLLENPCPRSVIPDRSTWRKSNNCSAGDVFDQSACNDAQKK